MKQPNYQAVLPAGYREIYHIDAKDKRTGTVLTVASFVIMAVVCAVAILAAKLGGFSERQYDPTVMLWASVIMLVALVSYLILHELLHGLAYKLLTHQKLTFGMSWSCAFCGVPDIYTSRRTALIALVLPFAVFTLLLLPLTVLFFFLDPLAYGACTLLLGIHLGGCIGDLYMTWLLLFRYRDPRLLLRDTGPEQFLYLPQ